MRNRELMYSKCEQLESNMNKLNFLIKRSANIQDYMNCLDDCRELLEQLKSFIDTEPKSPNEINQQVNP